MSAQILDLAAARAARDEEARRRLPEGAGVVIALLLSIAFFWLPLFAWLA